MYLYISHVFQSRLFCVWYIRDWQLTGFACNSKQPHSVNVVQGSPAVTRRKGLWTTWPPDLSGLFSFLLGQPQGCRWWPVGGKPEGSTALQSSVGSLQASGVTGSGCHPGCPHDFSRSEPCWSGWKVECLMALLKSHPVPKNCPKVKTGLHPPILLGKWTACPHPAGGNLRAPR